MQRRACWVMLGAFLPGGLWAACGSPQAATRPDRIAVLPLASVGTTDGSGPALRGEMTEALETRTDATVLAQGEVDTAFDEVCGHGADRWDCLDKNPNLFLLGRKLEAHLVIAGQVAAMGDRHALKLRVAEVGTGRVSTETWNAAGENNEPFLAGLLDLHARLSPRETPEPWYRRWETWTIAGASVAVVTGAVVIGVLLSSNGNGSTPGDYDFDKTLP